MSGLVVKSGHREIAEFAVEARCYCEGRADAEVQVDIALDAKCDGGDRKRCDNTILVQANGADDATLMLSNKRGEVIDEVAVHVRAAERAAVFEKREGELARRETAQLVLKVDASAELEAELYDKTGKRLVAPEGVAWRVSSEASGVAEISAFLVAADQEISTSLDATLHVISAGEGTLHIEVPGLEWKLPFAVEAE